MKEIMSKVWEEKGACDTCQVDKQIGTWFKMKWEEHKETLNIDYST